MDIFAKLCIGLAVILLAFFIALFAFRLKSFIETRVLLSRRERDVKLVYNVLAANYSEKMLLRMPVFPYNLSPDSRLFRPYAVVVNHGGVLILSVCDLRGTVENPFSGDWRMFGSDSLRQITNPVELSAGYSRAISLLLREKEISNVPVSSAVVYLDPKAKFKNHIGNVVCVDNLTGYIHDINRNRMLSWSEMNSTMAALREFRRKPAKKKN